MPLNVQTLQKKTKLIHQSGQYVVAVGASAGGLEAIHELFDHMPASASLSFVVIQHLSSDYKSLLVELVSKHTRMKVFEAEHNMAIHPDCVYIIPNNKLMTVKGGRLKLADKAEHKAPNTAIDKFLVTLAEDKKNKAIAIILSGTGSDGTRGIECIKENGGLVIVQEPSSAKFDGMPNSAITSGNADYILPPSKIYEEIFRYINEEPVKLVGGGKADDVLLDKIFKLVYDQSGNDFNLYKTPTILRRIGRRMNDTGIRNLNDYVKFMEGNSSEVKTLGKDFLIGVTKFFRDKAAFECLSKEVIPQIVGAKSGDDILKIWVCACSTGEEAYTIAILVDECLSQLKKRLEVKIFATDIDETSIEIASKNQYPLSIAKEIPAPILKKYFVKEHKCYSVIPAIRKQIVFAKHDVIKSPPFIKNDLVTCRNMLIYMNNLLQHKVLSIFHFSLNQGGYLFLGSSETAGAIKDGLVEISGKWKIFKKSGYITYSVHNYYHINSQKDSGTLRSNALKDSNQLTAIEKEFNDFVVADMGYAGIFIDKNCIIQEAIGNFRQFLSLPEKSIELNVLKMVPPELSVVLNTTLRKAWKENKKMHLKRLKIRKKDEEAYLNISIKPPEKDSVRMLTLIVLSEYSVETLNDKENIFLATIPDSQQNEYIFELEAELNETRNSLQMAVEEMETTNEELQSSNEELLSANEELQSSNEELQSLNEELHTLNTEHQLKIKELVELNDDLDNYFKSIDVGLIFLDANLQIRKFNSAAIHIVNLIDADVGRSIEQITNNFKEGHLVNDIRSVLLSGTFFEQEVLLKNGRRTLMRIMPYTRRDKKTDGVVLSFVDISVITNLNNIISGVFNASISAILAFEPVFGQNGNIIDFRCVTFNEQALSMLQKNQSELTKAFLLKQLPEIAEANLFSKYVQVTEKGDVFQVEMQLQKNEWYQVVAVKMGEGFAVTFTNITKRKIADQKLKKNYNELVNTRENLKALNNELEEKVKARTDELAKNNERFSFILKASNDTLWDWDLVNNNIWRSDNFTSMFGYHLTDEIREVNFWFDNIHPEDRDRLKTSVFDAINNGKSHWSEEYRFCKADKNYAIVLDRGSIIRDDFGTPYRMVGSTVDVTRLVAAEKKVTTTEHKFKKIFESNLIGMLFSDLETGHILSANSTFLRMIGYSVDDLENRQLSWKQITPPEYLEISITAANQIKENGYCRPFEKEYFHKDGTRISVLVGSAQLSDENPCEAVTYIIDITREKEEEKKKIALQRLVEKQQNEFYSIFKSAPALISIRRGSDLRYEFVNDAILGLGLEKDFLNRPFLEVHPGLKNSALSEADSKVLGKGETVIVKSLKVTDGTFGMSGRGDRWFDCIFTPVFTDSGAIDGVAFFGFDVTDLLVAQKATKELMTKKDEFMSIASHELKTPITTIKGALQLALRATERQSPVATVSTLLEKANKQTAKLTSLVDDLLDVTKINAGKLQLNYVEFSINELVVECIDEIQHNLKGHKISFRPGEDFIVNADRHRVEQVIINFLSNAAKYSPNEKNIVIKTEKDGEEIKVSVQDFGIGIPEDKKAYVFDRFFRVQEGSSKFSGLGLGLYISAEIIQRLGGRIGLISEEGTGSEFWFTLPLIVK